jgi:hypothetical protein
MRGHACVDRLHLYSSVGAPQGEPGAEQLVGEVHRLFEASWPNDVEVLDAYLEWAAAHPTSELDVCRVGAERLFLAGTFALLAQARPALRAVSDGLASLSKRWYLLHTIAAAGMVGSAKKQERMRRLLAELRERELRLAETFRREGRPSEDGRILSLASDCMETDR